MRFARRGKIGLDAQVELLRADPEPDSAAAPERLRLLELLEPEQAAEEAAGGLLAAGGGGELDVVDASEHRLRLPGAGYAPGYSRSSRNDVLCDRRSNN